MQALFSLINSIQQRLFPFIEGNIAPLTEKEREFVRAAEMAAVGKYSKVLKKWIGNGRKPHSRKAIAHAFIAKAVWNFPTTLLLIDCLKSSQTLRMAARRLAEWTSRQFRAVFRQEPAMAPVLKQTALPVIERPTAPELKPTITPSAVPTITRSWNYDR
jgi:hypothetical protein